MFRPARSGYPHLGKVSLPLANWQKRDFSGSEEETLKRIGIAISSYPPGFTPHRNLARILSARDKTVEEGRNIDWSTAEALAFGSLALEKIHVRVSGQDVERGTFSQRHTVIHDRKSEQQYIPLNDIGSNHLSLSYATHRYANMGRSVLSWVTRWFRRISLRSGKRNLEIS